MPELNNDAPDSSAPELAWPELTPPGGHASHAGNADPAVRSILDRVREVPALPVSEHPAAYADMHDALLLALNDEPPREEPREEPQHGPGAA